MRHLTSVVIRGQRNLPLLEATIGGVKAVVLAVTAVWVVGCSGGLAPTAIAPSAASTVTPPPAAATLAVPSASPTATAAPTDSRSATPTPVPSHGCGVASPSPAPAPDTSAGCATLPPLEARELPGAGTRLEPDVYTRSSFTPRVTFEVGLGWTAVQQVAGFFDIQDEPGSLDVVAVQFANVVGVASAEEAIGEIAETAHLDVSIAESVVIDGVAGHRVVVQTLDPADSQPPIFRDVLTARPGPLGIASGRRLEVTLLDVRRGVLAILVGGSIAEWDHALEISRPVLESITIG